MQKLGIEVDLGGTKIEIAMASTDGHLLDRLRIPTEKSAEGSEQVIEKITENIGKLSKQYPDINAAIPLEEGNIIAGKLVNNVAEVLLAGVTEQRFRNDLCRRICIT